MLKRVRILKYPLLLLRPFLVIYVALVSCKPNSPTTTKFNVADDEGSVTELIPEDIVSETVLNALDYDTLVWMELTEDDSIMLDLRYAEKDNFTGQVIYPCARCILRREVSEKLMSINRQLLRSKGLRMKFFDCYRPLPAQQKLWDIVPDATYVANPQKGSMHNRGAAIDLTLVDSNGNEINMGSDFDEFGVISRHDNYQLPKEVLDNRAFLKSTMESAGFKSIKSEWWHYSLSGTGSPITDWQWACNH